MTTLIGTRRLLSNNHESRLEFEIEKSGAISIRYLRLDDKRAYECGNNCNTCAFWFERRDGANGSLSFADAAEILNLGLVTLDDKIIQNIADCLPCGDYIAILGRITPKLVLPSDQNDYFCQEQVQLWGIDPFWGLPHHPRTEYYRAGSRAIGEDKGFFEFVVPMFPHGWLKLDRLAEYKYQLGRGGRPTAVGLGFLDVRSPADFDLGPGQALPGIREHWCFPSFLIDGHHKVYAAAALGCDISLLTFLAPSKGTADVEQIEAMLTFLGSSPSLFL